MGLCKERNRNGGNRIRKSPKAEIVRETGLYMHKMFVAARRELGKRASPAPHMNDLAKWVSKHKKGSGSENQGRQSLPGRGGRSRLGGMPP